MKVRTEYQREYRKKHLEQLRAYRREYYQKDPEKYREYSRQYQRENYKANLETNREKRRNNNMKRRLEILSLFGRVCARCGFKDWRALQIDHVNGGGTTARKILPHSNSALLKIIKANPGRFQVLCANCNWIKRCEKGELRYGN